MLTHTCKEIWVFSIFKTDKNSCFYFFPIFQQTESYHFKMEMGAAKIVTYKKLWEIGKCLFFSFCHCFQPFRLLRGVSRKMGESLVAFAARAPLVLQLDQVSCWCVLWDHLGCPPWRNSAALRETRKEGQVLKLSNEEFLKSASRWRTLLRGTRAVACGLFWTLTTQWNFLLS